MQADAIYHQRGKSLELLVEPYRAGAPVTGRIGVQIAEALRRSRSRCSRSNQYR